MLTKLTDRRALRRWSRALDGIDQLDPEQAKRLQIEADRLSKRLNRVLNAVERHATPTLQTIANQNPLHADWTWCPSFWNGPLTPSGVAQVESGARLSSDTALFHDCSLNDITLRQTRDPSSSRFEARIETLDFSGSYISMAIDLPTGATAGLTASHIISCNAFIEMERTIEVYARLNLGFGPNVESLIVKRDPNSVDEAFEFDLSSATLDESRLDRAWIDLIFDAPAYNQISIKGVTLHRHPRAEV